MVWFFLNRCNMYVGLGERWHQRDGKIFCHEDFLLSGHCVAGQRRRCSACSGLITARYLTGTVQREPGGGTSCAASSGPAATAPHWTVLQLGTAASTPPAWPAPTAGRGWRVSSSHSVSKPSPSACRAAYSFTTEF